MNGTSGAPKEIAVPISVFEDLRRELSKEAGPLPTIHALHAAGFSGGRAAATAFLEGAEADVTSMAQNAFWARLCSFFSRRGWGVLNQTALSPAVSLLMSDDWAESHETEPDAEGSCSFSTGFLSGLLTELAGGPVAVLEVECRTRGDDRCAFAFGSEHAIHDLYGRLLEDTDLDGAVAAL
jgi:V4R domain